MELMYSVLKDNSGGVICGRIMEALVVVVVLDVVILAVSQRDEVFNLKPVSQARHRFTAVHWKQFVIAEEQEKQLNPTL